MFDGIWAFLKDSANQAVLGWIGGGVVVVVGGFWAVVRFYASRGDDKAMQSVRAEGKSVAAGCSINNSPINIDTRGAIEKPRPAKR